MNYKALKGMVLILSLVFATSVMAHGDKEKAQALTKSYQYELNMTLEQSNQFVQVVEKYLKQRSEVKMNTTYDVNELNKALRNISDRENQEMATFLTPEQHRAYKKMKKKLQPIAEVQ